MADRMPIKNTPDVNDLWQGIGGHFDSLGQIINEFIDNSISNFIANPSAERNITITLEEMESDGRVKISIEDSGTGIKDINAAFTLGTRCAAESPLNEHGFGLKHALASANPANDAWCICTRTQADVARGCYLKICAPYLIENFEAELCHGNTWPGQHHGTGTFVEFICSRDMYKTLTRGIRGGMTSFSSIADVLCEDIGFVYSGVIQSGVASITLRINRSDEHATHHIGAVTPDWKQYIDPQSKGSECIDLGGGPVTLEYQFGSIHEKAERQPFDNASTRKYYKRNMSSGVEIRINGRMICYNLFKEIWSTEKHNSYNHLLVIVDIKSTQKEALPKTRTSKNGLREGDSKLESLYEWIRTMMKDPPKDISLSDNEVELFEELKKCKEHYNPDPNKILETQKYVFTSTGDKRDKVRIDFYEKTMGNVLIYEGKKDSTTSKDVYQLRMYWDGLVFDGINPDGGILVAAYHPQSVLSMIEFVNNMFDANGNHYRLEAKTWHDLHINYPPRS